MGISVETGPILPMAQLNFMVLVCLSWVISFLTLATYSHEWSKKRNRVRRGGERKHYTRARSFYLCFQNGGPRVVGLQAEWANLPPPALPGIGTRATRSPGNPPSREATGASGRALPASRGRFREIPRDVARAQDGVPVLGNLSMPPEGFLSLSNSARV